MLQFDILPLFYIEMRMSSMFKCKKITARMSALVMFLFILLSNSFATAQDLFIPSEWAAEVVSDALASELVPSLMADKDYIAEITRQEFAHLCVNLYSKLLGI